jgi:cardiolipin synthase
MNADNRSMSFNDESNLVILNDDVATRMEKLFIDDLEYSEEIDLAEFRKRGMRDRLYERACHLVWRVL